MKRKKYLKPKTEKIIFNYHEIVSASGETIETHAEIVDDDKTDDWVD